ncbi:radical SAM/SPASM domain-containing protein [Thermodesulfobacteriota bacterium]
MMERIPPEVNVETTSVCNAQCIMCPISKIDRPKRAMDMSLFKKIVDDCIKSGVRCIKLHNYGEPLLTPRFDEMLHYIRSKSRSIQIQFASNGSLLNDKWAGTLIGQKVNRVLVTIDGFKKETYEKIRIGLKYHNVVQNVLNFMNIKKNMGVNYPELFVEMIEMDENRDEVDNFLDFWKGKVDHIIVNTYATRAGEFKGDEFGGVKPRPCFRLWKQIVITNTGKVATCCNDWNCKSILGDVKSQSISEIWQGSKIKRLRRMHLKDQAREISLCKNCNPAAWDSMPQWWFM